MSTHRGGSLSLNRGPVPSSRPHSSAIASLSSNFEETYRNSTSDQAFKYSSRGQMSPVRGPRQVDVRSHISPVREGHISKKRQHSPDSRFATFANKQRSGHREQEGRSDKKIER